MPRPQRNLTPSTTHWHINGGDAHIANGHRHTNGTRGGGDVDRGANLPIFYVKRRITRILSRELTCVFSGETGSGKSTQIPQFCLDAGLADDGAVAVTEPRKVAARALANRVADEMDCNVGDKVGYKFRFEEKIGDETKLVYMTDGILLREALNDCLLTKYSTVIVDEVHERSVHTDVLLSVLRLAQLTRKKADRPLRVFLMSATADTDKFAEYFSDAPVYHIFGRTHQVELFASEQMSINDGEYLHNAVSAVMLLHETEPIENGFLVFLTGQEEINAAVRTTRNESKNNRSPIIAHALYSSIDPSQQEKCFQPVPYNSRKVIFATNIAETSLTIPGIRVVIDTGKVKQKTFNAERGVDVMKVVPISKAQAIQRAGRAGRVARGKCYRLYSTDDYNRMTDVQPPEILRSNLSAVILNLAGMGLKRTRNIQLLDMPNEQLLNVAVEELRQMGALDFDDQERFSVSDVGRRLSRFPIEPKHAMILHSAEQLRCLEEALTIVSFLSIDSVFAALESNELLGVASTSDSEHRHEFDANEGDHIRMLKIYRTFHSKRQNNRDSVQEWCKMHRIIYRRMEEVVRVRKQLREIAQKQKYEIISCGHDYTPLRKAICRGLRLNACVYDRASATYRLQRRPNVTVKIHPSSCLARTHVGAFVFTDLVDTTETYARDVCLVDVDWLTETAVEQRSRGRVAQSSSSSYSSLSSVSSSTASVAAARNERGNNEVHLIVTFICASCQKCDLVRSKLVSRFKSMAPSAAAALPRQRWSTEVPCHQTVAARVIALAMRRRRPVTSLRYIEASSPLLQLLHRDFRPFRGSLLGLETQAGSIVVIVVICCMRFC